MINIIIKEKKFLIFLFIISFIFRFLFFEFFLFKNNGHWVCVDSNEYHSVAKNIAKGNGILNENGIQTAYRVPGYPIFIACCFKLFSILKSDLNKSFNYIKPTLIFQIILSSFIPILVFLLSYILFPFLSVAKLSSILMSISVGAILHSGLLMSESLFLFFFILFCIFFFRSFNLFFCSINADYVSYKKIFLAGLFLGLTSLIRPVGHFLLILSIFLLIFSSFNFVVKIKSSGILFLGWFIVVLPWLLRNFFLVGVFIFHTMPGFHFLNYFAAEVESNNMGYSYFYAKDKLLSEWNDLVKKSSCRENEFKYFDLAQQVAIKYLRKNPSQTIKHAITNILKTTLSLHSSYIWFITDKNFNFYEKKTRLIDKVKRYLLPKTENRFLIFLIYYEIITLLFVLLGFLGSVVISCFNKNLFCVVLKILPFIFLLLFLTLGSGVARLRLSFEPLLLILTSIFYERVYCAIIIKK